MAPPHNTKVCVILLNWNGWRDTQECLHSLINLNIRPAAILVVDNGSTDDSVERIVSWAEHHFEQVPLTHSEEADFNETIPPFLLIRNSSNLGFAGGNNTAISLALRHGSFDFIWLLNNDTTVRPDTLETILRSDRKEQAGIYGSTVVHSVSPKTIQCAGGCFYNPLTTIFKPFLAGESLSEIKNKNYSAHFDYIFGASLFVRTELFSLCGLLNDDYFLFYEEIDLCKRAAQKKFTTHWCSDSLVLHKGSSTVGKPGSANKQKIAFANYHENLSTLIFTRRFYPWLLPFTMLFRFFGKLLMTGKRGDWYLARPLFEAYRDFFIRRNKRGNYL